MFSMPGFPSSENQQSTEKKQNPTMCFTHTQPGALLALSPKHIERTDGISVGCKQPELGTDILSAQPTQYDTLYQYLLASWGWEYKDDVSQCTQNNRDFRPCPRTQNNCSLWIPLSTKGIYTFAGDTEPYHFWKLTRKLRQKCINTENRLRNTI